MKKSITLILILAFAIAAFSGCASTSKTDGLSPEELERLYAEAITDARDDDLNSAFPVMLGSEESEDEVVAEMLLELLAFKSEDAEAYAMSISLMNVKAYGIVVVKPAEGKADAVKDGLQGFIDQQCQSFANYLADQYEIAKNARLETLNDGTIVMVMSPDQDAVYDSIAKSIQGT